MMVMVAAVVGVVVVMVVSREHGGECMVSGARIKCNRPQRIPWPSFICTAVDRRGGGMAVAAFPTGLVESSILLLYGSVLK